MENTEDRAGATSEQQDNVINTVNSLDPYGPSWQLVPGNVAAGTVYAQVPTSGTGDLTFTRASTATRTNSAGTIVNVATGVPRIHYRNADGSLSSTGHLLLEPQRTNSIRNSSAIGAVAGTPGTLPTNWTQITIGGLTRTIVGTGTENGLSYVDIRYNGTATGPSTFLGFETVTAITAATGQTWNGSFYLKTIATPSPPNSFRSTIAEYTSLGVYIRDVAIAITPTSNLNRFSQTETLAGGATTARVVNGIAGILTNGAAYDFTIRIAAPQMELGAYATTFIPTTTAAVTRVADAASKTGVSSLIGQTEGTIFIDFESGVNDSTEYAFSVNNNNISNFITIFKSMTNTISCRITVGGVVQATINSTTAVQNTRYKAAVAYKLNDIAFYVNGVLIGTDTSATIPSCNTIATSIASFSPFYRPINAAALITRRLTNAELAAITTL